MEPKRLNCAKGLSEKDATCIGCERAKEKISWIWKDGKRFYYMTKPDGSTKLKKIKRFTGDCDRWQLKQPDAACGCGGEFKCECGWKEQVCATIYKTATCPWCGRIVSLTSYPKLFKVW